MERLIFNKNKVENNILHYLGRKSKRQVLFNLDTQSWGNIYKHPIVGWTVASKPGDAPNNQTGDLRATVRYRKGKSKMFLKSGSNKVNYARFLETVNNRPNVSIVLDKILKEREVKDSIENFFLKGIKVR